MKKNVFEVNNPYGLASFKDAASAKKAIENVVKENLNIDAVSLKEGDVVKVVGIGVAETRGQEFLAMACDITNNGETRKARISPSVFNRRCVLTGDRNTGNFQPVGNSNLEVAEACEGLSFTVSNKRKGYGYEMNRNKPVKADEVIDGQSVKTSAGNIYKIIADAVNIFDFSK